MVLRIPEHRDILLQVLKDIYSDTNIAPFLGFKGGTAAYIFYNLSRFSIDLDFDLINEDKEEEVFDKIEKIVKKYGEIKEARKKGSTCFSCFPITKKHKMLKLKSIAGRLVHDTK